MDLFRAVEDLGFVGLVDLRCLAIVVVAAGRDREDKERREQPAGGDEFAHCAGF
jgi:hypothetical protein